MNLQEIKSALKAGKKVYWSNKAYEVIQSKFTQEYLVKCQLNILEKLGSCLRIEEDQLKSYFIGNDPRLVKQNQRDLKGN